MFGKTCSKKDGPVSLWKRKSLPIYLDYIICALGINDCFPLSSSSQQLMRKLMPNTGAKEKCPGDMVEPPAL